MSALQISRVRENRPLRFSGNDRARSVSSTPGAWGFSVMPSLYDAPSVAQVLDALESFSDEQLSAIESRAGALRQELAMAAPLVDLQPSLFEAAA